jgi:hypothetical protein
LPFISDDQWNNEIRHIRLIHEDVKKVLARQERQMALEDDLNNTATALATGFQALDQSVQAVVAWIKGQPNLEPAVRNAIDSIGQTTKKMAADAAALTAAIPAATTVTGPSAPAPAPTPTAPPVTLGTVPVTDPTATPPSTPPPAATSTAG